MYLMAMARNMVYSFSVHERWEHLCLVLYIMASSASPDTTAMRHAQSGKPQKQFQTKTGPHFWAF
jgi:hypothetical protein